MRTLLGFFAVGFAGTLALNGCNCGEKNLGGVPGNLDGQVCDPTSGAPLAGAAVTITGAKTKTTHQTLADGQGKYAFTLIPRDTYEITATFGSLTRTLDPSAAVDSQHSDADGFKHETDTACRVQPGDLNDGELDGQICNRHTGSYVTDASVSITTSDGKRYATTTDPTGAFKLKPAPSGTQVAVISGAGYQRAFPVEIVAGQITNLDLAEGCQPVSASEGGIYGSFCDPSQGLASNLVGASVTATLQGGAGQNDTYVDVTDENGLFEINGMQPGTYTVVVQGATAAFTLPNISVSPGTETEVTDPDDCGIRARVGSIAGQLCNLDAGGVFTGNVDLLDALGNALSPPLSTTTDSTGQFHFDQIAEGNYLVHVYTPAYSKNYPAIVTAFQTFIIDDGTCPDIKDVCSDVSQAPTVSTDGRIFLVVDRSGSMGDNDLNSQQKWASMKTALEHVTANLTSTVEFGLTMFPQPNSGDVCEAGGSVEVSLAKNNASAIQSNLEAVGPAGGTPTAATLNFVKSQLVQSGVVNDGRPLAVVLATDGGPNCNQSLDQFAATCTCTQPGQQGNCGPDNCLDDLNTINAVGALKDLGVNVFIIGEVGSENFAGVLNNMANVGGTALPGPTHFYQVTNEASLENAIGEIANRVVACHVPVPSVDLPNADSIAVNIGTQTINRDLAHQNGWDINGDGIDLYGTACDTASSSSANVTVHTCFPPP